MFVLDVSRSMLAEDAAPNRLERAKQQIKDTVDEMAGNRVGLMVFAGDVKQQIPLTTHYDDFKQMLDEAGRTMFAAAARVWAMRSTPPRTHSSRNRTLIRRWSFSPMAKSRRANRSKWPAEVHKETGVRIFTVGLGDMEKGARIPVRVDERQEYLTHDGAAGVVKAPRRNPSPSRHRDRRGLHPCRHQASEHVGRLPQLHRRHRARAVRNRADQSV